MHYKAYMFGSALHGVGEDIDILIVGPSGDLLSQLKKELRSAGNNLPLHILYMQPSEEQHTQFVEKERCISLTQLAAAYQKGSSAYKS